MQVSPSFCLWTTTQDTPDVKWQLYTLGEKVLAEQTESVKCNLFEWLTRRLWLIWNAFIGGLHRLNRTNVPQVGVILWIPTLIKHLHKNEIPKGNLDFIHHLYGIKCLFGKSASRSDYFIKKYIFNIFLICNFLWLQSRLPYSSFI